MTSVESSVTEQSGGIGNNLRSRRRRHSLSTGVPEVGGGDALETTPPGQGTAGDASTTAPGSVPMFFCELFLMHHGRCYKSVGSCCLFVGGRQIYITESIY